MSELTVGIGMFAREPVAGQVKTRLIPVLGAEGALDLYRQLLNLQIAILQNFTRASLELWVDGDPDHEAFNAFPGAKYQQVSGDLGRRMEVTVGCILERCHAAIIIGSDCPGLNSGYLDQAIELLSKKNQAVIGPARDGGYVLIGLKAQFSELFQNISWGSGSVLQETLAKLDVSGACYELLPEMVDIDRSEDLESLAQYGIFPQISKRLIS